MIRAYEIPNWLFFIDINNYKTISFSLKQEIIKLIPSETEVCNDYRFEEDLFNLCHNHILKHGRDDYDKSDIMEIYDFIYHLYFIDSNRRRKLNQEIRYWLHKNVNPTISFMFENPEN
jgi:hypothetical protein